MRAVEESVRAVVVYLEAIGYPEDEVEEISFRHTLSQTLSVHSSLKQSWMVWKRSTGEGCFFMCCSLTLWMEETPASVVSMFPRKLMHTGIMIQ